MSEIQYDYDVIVVGGRPSGSTLAARLGQGGVRVLLLERAKLPSLPAASSPVIYASVMSMLDEIGADENEYARNTPKIRRMINVTPDLQMEMRVPMGFGRDYGYAIDRSRFDYALWQTAAHSPNVTAWHGVSVTDVLVEDGTVIGVKVTREDKTPQTFHARLVVGADGRFSTVARKVDARTYDEHEDNPTSLLYAYWSGAQLHDDGEPALMAYGDGVSGYGFLVMDSADDTLVVAIEGRADALEFEGGQSEAFYKSLIMAQAPLSRRLQGATLASDVRGMRKVGNLYRQPGGQGWALVGDAYHQKDPLDGQGIYDAVFTAKKLSEAILRWHAGEQTWEDALLQYNVEARAETYPMYQSTLNRVQGSFYSNMPPWLVKVGSQTFVRWLMEDRLVQEQMGMMITRQVKPNQVMGAPTVVGALLRGPLRDLSKRLDEEIARTR
jgi:flavin-dependent dehydrogenase